MKRVMFCIVSLLITGLICACTTKTPSADATESAPADSSPTVLTDSDFKKTTWGMSMNEVDDSVDGALLGSASVNSSCYQTIFADMNAVVLYRFNSNSKLVASEIDLTILYKSKFINSK